MNRHDLVSDHPLDCVNSQKAFARGLFCLGR